MKYILLSDELFLVGQGGIVHVETDTRTDKEFKTVVTLAGGKRISVKESVEEIAKKIQE